MPSPDNPSATSYDRLSRWYDLIAFNSEKRLARMAIQQLDLHPGEIVLEIGCGTGNNLIEMVKYITPPGKILGLDKSPGMIEVARRKVDQLQFQGTITLLKGDANHLPIASQTIHAALLCFTLELFDADGIDIITTECKRILAPAGRICVAGLSRKPGNTIPVRIYDWFHGHFPTWIDCRPILIEQTLSAAGFSILSTMLFSLFGLPVEIIVADVK